MAETPSRHVNFVSKTVKVVDGDLDEISNKTSHARSSRASTAHVGTETEFVQGSINVLGDVCFPG